MKKRHLILAYISILLAYSLPLSTKIVQEQGVPKPEVPSHIEPLQAVQKAEIGILTTKQVEAVKVPVKSDTQQIKVGCNTGNMYKDYIYSHESGCNPSSVNSIGCRGIGQACPGSKLPCGADFACQDAYFSNYAVQRYGSWQGAYNAWLVQHWW